MATTNITDGSTVALAAWGNDVDAVVYEQHGVGKTTVASATTPNIFAATVGNFIDYTGTATCTGFVAAVSAGSHRVLYCAGAAVFTAGANLLIDGVASASNLTCVAGDILDVVANTTTQFKITKRTLAISAITNSLAADVNLNNVGLYFTGPTVAQGTAGKWFVSGTVSLNTTTSDSFYVKLWDGTTVIASAFNELTSGLDRPVSLSGYISSPAGNLCISVRDISSTNGKILANSTGEGKDSTITAIKIG